jgi:hypothetical protein
MADSRPSDPLPFDSGSDVSGMLLCKRLTYFIRNVDTRYVVWFDIDNTLYSQNSKVLRAMVDRIHGPCHFLILHASYDLLDF